MSKPLMYHNSVTELRTGLMRVASAAQSKAEQLMEAGAPTLSDKTAMNASFQVVNYACTLSALLAWIGREHGEDAQHKAARMVDNMLMNGDDTDFNEDVMPSAEAQR